MAERIATAVWCREEIELLRDVAAEIEAEEYAADSEAALRTRQASLTKDQTQLLDSSLPMKNIRADNPLSLPSAPAGTRNWESGGFSASGKQVPIPAFACQLTRTAHCIVAVY